METLIQNPVEQIIDIYSSNEFWWVEEKAAKDSLRSYIWQLVDRGNIFWAVNEGKVVGVCETWKIDFQTLGKLVCKINDAIEYTNTTDGIIAFVVNVWIDKECRQGRVFREMKKEWYKRFHECAYYVGHAQRKSLGMYKAFKVSDLKSSLFKIGE
jgi:hypothetical protein